MRLGTKTDRGSTGPGVQVLTQCESVEDFVSKFRRFCGESSIFVPTTAPVPHGVQDHFSIRLRTGDPVLSGVGVVIESQTAESASGTSRMAGMRIRFIALDSSSQSILQWLGAARKVRGNTQDDVQLATPAPRRSAPLAAVSSCLARLDARASFALGPQWKRRALIHTAALGFGLAIANQIWGA